MLPDMRVAIVADQAVVAAHEAPHVVAKAAVPLRPARARELADLVEAAGVPRLGDHLRVGELLGELDVPDDRRELHRRAVAAAVQHRALVEAEAVDVHLLDPVLQAVDDELLHDRMVRVDRVPAARVVHVVLRLGRVRAGSSASLPSPLKLIVGPMWLPSAVWLKTTSRITSIPALCSAFTMSRNSSRCEPSSGLMQ